MATVYPDGRITYELQTDNDFWAYYMPSEIPNLLPGEIPPSKEECLRLRQERIKNYYQSARVRRKEL